MRVELKYSLSHTHSKKRKMCEMMDVLINSTVGISSLCISNLQVVYFKDIIILFVNYISIKLKKRVN